MRIEYASDLNCKLTDVSGAIVHENGLSGTDSAEVD